MSKTRCVIGMVTSGRIVRAHGLVQELEKQTCKDPSICIIVVENGTLHAHKPAYIGSRTHWYHTQQASIPAARNTIYSQAQRLKATHLAFIDDDCWPDETWTKRMAMYTFDKNVAAATGKCLSVPQANRYACISGILYDLWIQQNTNNDGTLKVLDTKNVVFNLKLLRQIPSLFSEELMYGSDINVAHRIRSSGMQLRYLPDAVVQHTERTTFFTFVLHRARLSVVYRSVLERTHSFHSVSLATKFAAVINNLPGGTLNKMLGTLSLVCAYALACTLLVQQKITNMAIK